MSTVLQACRQILLHTFLQLPFDLPPITTKPVVKGVVINSYLSAYTEIINKGIYSS